MTRLYDLDDDFVVVVIGSGAGGGTVVAQGTPEDVAANPASHTGQYLRRYLSLD